MNTTPRKGEALNNSQINHNISTTMTTINHSTNNCNNNPMLMSMMMMNNNIDDDDDIDDSNHDNKKIGNNNSTTSSSSITVKRKWDPIMLSSICRWRSCLCESVVTYSNKFISDSNNRDMKKMMMTLCSYHVELKYYLDQKSLIKSYNNSSKSTSNNNNNGVLESLKYLPKKPPLFNNTNNNGGGGGVGGNDNNTTTTTSSSNIISESKRAMLTIRAASTLLQELWDGKLRVTVRSFTRKVIKDMSYRVYLEDSFDTFCKIYNNNNNNSSNADGGNSSNNNNNNNGTKSKRSSSSNISHVNNNVTVVTKNIFIHPLFSDVRTLVVIPNRPTWAIWQNSEYLKK